jgi:hypothetical protein
MPQLGDEEPLFVGDTPGVFLGDTPGDDDLVGDVTPLR